MNDVARILGVQEVTRVLLCVYTGNTCGSCVDSAEQVLSGVEHYLRVPSSKRPNARMVVRRLDDKLVPKYATDVNTSKLNNSIFSWWTEEVVLPVGVVNTPLLYGP